MTINQLQPFEDSSSNNTQQQQVFQVVLIDIKKAAKGEIHCIKKPLEGNIDDLKYVAISYRWGELNEVVIDTDVEYLASVKSFDLDDFYQLCAMMTKEPDLQHMDYVWVDTICINQANYEQRKATIYHMTNIYQQATWILAVPDLHAEYLRKTMSTNKQTMNHIRQHQTYIYHLIHQNMKQLVDCDDAFLDSAGVPQDQALRRMLTKYTGFLTAGMVNMRKHNPRFNHVEALDHLYHYSCCHSSPEPSSSSSTSSSTSSPTSALVYLPSNHDGDDDDEKNNKIGLSYIPDYQFVYKEYDFGEPWDVGREVDTLHPCQSIRCPFKHSHYNTGTIYYDKQYFDQGEAPKKTEWHRYIFQRSQCIRQSMHFLTDLMMDWSTRVWVISEFTIAKEKNNLKYWFTLLTPQEEEAQSPCSFFKFDATESRPAIMPFYVHSDHSPIVLLDPVRLIFHYQLIKQLNNQSFVEMMLKSKATKHEDRIYSIFPLYPEYKKLLRNSNNDDVIKTWDVGSILSIKLKLYEVMATKDQLDLLYLSCKGEEAHILPTFATSTIYWQGGAARYSRWMSRNEDDIAGFNITLHKTTTTDSLYYLHVKVPGYCKAPHLTTHDTMMTTLIFQDNNKKRKAMLCQRLGLDKHDAMDLVCIPNSPKEKPHHGENDYFEGDTHFIYLVGCFGKNIWIVANYSLHLPEEYDDNWTDHTLDDQFSGFNVY